MVATMARPRSDNRIISSHRTDMTIECRRRIDGEEMALEGYIGDHLLAEFEFVENEAGPGRLEFNAKSRWAKIVSRCDKENIFIHAQINGEWWTGRVDRVRKKRKGKVRTVIAELVSDYVWLEAMFAWPAPFMPLFAQVPKKDVMVAPAHTMIKTYLFKTIFRLQANLYKFPVGFFNDPINNGWWNVEKWSQPCVVLPVNPIFDDTRWNTLLARMTPLDQLFKQLLKDEHLVLTAKAWIPGRDPQPHKDIVLTKPCIVFDVIDKRKAQGSHGTILDGLFRTIIDTLDPFIQPVIGMFTGDSDKYSLAHYFGTDPADPWVVFREGDYTDIEESEVVINSPQAHTGIVGGHSPEWVNKGIELLVNSAIQGLLGAIGIGFLGNLINGELDDILLAFQSTTNHQVREQFGVFTLPEAFDPTGTTAFTFDAVQALRQLMWEIRPHRSFNVTINDGKPFIPFVHFTVGDPVGWEDEDEIFVDYVRRIIVTDDRSSRAKIQIVIGDEEDKEEPMAESMRRIAGVKQAFDFWTLSDT